MVKMGAHEFVYPNFGYWSRWLRNRDPVYGILPAGPEATGACVTIFRFADLCGD